MTQLVQKIPITAFLFFISLFPLNLFAQNKSLYYNKVDTLKFFNRFNIKTNIFNWTKIIPNISLEFTLGNTNWHKWTITATGKFNWHTYTKDVPYNVYDIYAGQLELRRYWHGKSPNKVFYYGLYTSLNNFDLKFSSIGTQGKAVSCGFSIGTVSQLYGYKNGASLDLDIGISSGLVFAKFNKYKRELAGKHHIYSIIEPSNAYRLTFDPLIYSTVNDIVRISFVYHFGTKLANRFKSRKDVDNEYRIKLADEAYKRDTLRASELEKKQKRRIEKARKKRLTANKEL